jgi:hypothetical protein
MDELKEKVVELLQSYNATSLRAALDEADAMEEIKALLAEYPKEDILTAIDEAEAEASASEDADDEGDAA